MHANFVTQWLQGTVQGIYECYMSCYLVITADEGLQDE